jgi:hypothetical protein
MVTELPLVGREGRVYEIATYRITVPCQSEKDGTQIEEKHFFIALVHVDGSELHRTAHYDNEVDAYQDAFDWSKAQEKKQK